MNQIINMIMRLFVRKLVSKGIDAGFNKAASLRKPTQPQGEIDDHGNPVQTQADVRRTRQAKKQARHAKQSMKVMRRVSKF